MVRKTSIEAYEEIKKNGLLSNLRFQVYEYLFKNGPSTAKQVAIGLKPDDTHTLDFGGTYTCRLSELREAQVVKEVGTTICEYTKRKVIVWEVTGNLPVKVFKKKTTKQKLAEANARIEELETFIAQMEDVPRGDSGGIASIEVYVARGSKEHKLWSDLRLKKYPGDY